GDPGERHRFWAGAADEPPHRLAEDLAAQVPEREIDQRLGGPAVSNLFEPVQHRKMAERIGALEQRPEEILQLIGDRYRILARMAGTADRLGDAFGAVVERKAQDDILAGTFGQ